MDQNRLVPISLSDEQAQKVGEHELQKICEMHGWDREKYTPDSARSLIDLYANEAKRKYAEAMAMLDL